MVLALKYGDLCGAISETNKLANELGQYSNELSQKVQQKMYAVEGGMSSALNSVDYYVNAKIKQLRTRENNARNLSLATQTLYDTAKRVDADVARTVQDNQKALFKKNPDLKAPWYKRTFISFMCDLKKVPVLGWLIKAREEYCSARDTLKNEIRRWWHTGGGKELITNLIDIVVKIGVAVAAVATFIAFIISGAGIVVLIAAGILAIVGVVNAISNIATSIQAIQAGKDHPAMSKIYADRNKLSDVLREENFGEKWNRVSSIGAAVLDTTEAVCEVVMIVESLKNWRSIVTSIKRSINGTLWSSPIGLLPKEQRTLSNAIWIGTRNITLKLYKGLPTLIKDGFKLSAFGEVLKAYKWYKHSADIISKAADFKKSINSIFITKQDYEKYKPNNITTSNSNLLRNAGNEKLKVPVFVFAQSKTVAPKFQYKYPYYNVAFAKST